MIGRSKTPRFGGPQPRMRDGQNDIDPSTVSPRSRRASRRTQIVLAALLPVAAFTLDATPDNAEDAVWFRWTDTPSSVPASSDQPAERSRENIEEANRLYAEMKERLRKAGTFIIINSTSAAEYILCKGTQIYGVEAGDTVEGIARRHTVHYEVAGAFFGPVGTSDMEHAIEDANPESSYKYGGGPTLRVGDELLVPMDGTCAGTTSRGIYERAGVPLPAIDR